MLRWDIGKRCPRNMSKARKGRKGAPSTQKPVHNPGVSRTSSRGYVPSSDTASGWRARRVVGNAKGWPERILFPGPRFIRSGRRPSQGDHVPLGKPRWGPPSVGSPTSLSPREAAPPNNPAPNNPSTALERTSDASGKRSMPRPNVRSHFGTRHGKKGLDEIGIQEMVSHVNDTSIATYTRTRYGSEL